MDPELPSDWIGAVTRPLRDNPELELAARQELNEQAGITDPDDLVAIVARFEAIDEGPPVKHRRLYWLPIVLALLAVIGSGIPVLLGYWSMHRMLFLTSGPHSVAEAVADRLTPEDHFFVYGNTRQPTRELAARALWQSQPENPALFGDYVAHCDPFPADMLETARRIDPDNGWFLLLAAAELSEGAVEQVYPSWGDPAEGEEDDAFPKWQVRDQGKFEAALELLEEAAAKPRIEYYGQALRKERLAILPPETDLDSRLVRLVFTATSGYRDFSMVGQTRQLMAAKAWTLGQSGDAEGLQQFMSTAETLCQRLAKLEGTLLYQVVNAGVASQTYEALHQACEQCELADEVRRLKPILRELENVPDGGRGHDSGTADLVAKHGGYFTHLTGAFTGTFSDRTPTLDELKPDRLMNYALADRAALWTATVLLLACLAAALVHPHLRGRLNSRLGHRFAQVPGRRDWLWIFALGTVAPLAWLLVITRATPLGCRDWGLDYRDFQPIATQYISTLLLIVTATAATIRWRLGRHAPFLRSRRPFVTNLVLANLTIAIPVAGLVRFDADPEALHGAMVLGLLGAIGLLFLAGRSVFGHHRHAIRRATISTLLAPALALPCLLLVSLIPSTYHAERHWIARDELLRTPSDGLGLNRLESDASQALQARLRVALRARE